MRLITVESSNISQIGFEENYSISFNQVPRNVLRIVFWNGNTYDFYNVEKEVYNSFLDSDSKGSYFHANIKNEYPNEKVS